MQGLLHSKQPQHHSGWQETYSPPAFWEWPSSVSYLGSGGGGGIGSGGGGASATNSASSASRQRPLSAGGRRSTSTSRGGPPPAPAPSYLGPAVQRTSTAPSGATRASIRSQQQQQLTTYPWTDNMYLGSGAGGREGQGSPSVGRLIFGLPLSPRSQKKVAAGLGVNRSAASSPSLAVNSTISYYTRTGTKGGSFRDDPDDGGSIRGSPTPTPLSPSAHHSYHPPSGGFVGSPLHRLPPKRTVSYSAREASAAPSSPLQHQEPSAHVKVSGAVATGVASAANSGGFSVRAMLHQQQQQGKAGGGGGGGYTVAGVKASSTTASKQQAASAAMMPFVVLDGEMVARAHTAAAATSGLGLSVSGRKVQS